MTVVAEFADINRDAVPLDIDHMLADIAVLDDPNEQLRRIDRAPYEQSAYKHNELLASQPELVAKTSAELADFAANPQSSSSLTVRIFALQKAIELGCGQALCDFQADSEVSRLASTLIYPVPYDYDHQRMVKSWRHTLDRLMTAEGVDEKFFWPDYFEAGGDPDAFCDHHPAKALVFLNTIARSATDERHSPASHELIEKFLPLMTAVNQQQAAMHGLPEIHRLQPLDDWPLIGVLSEYTAYGELNRAKVIEFLNSDDPAVEQYRAVFERLHFHANHMGLSFPDDYRKGVAQGFRHLMADAFYAVMQHAEQDKHTQVTLPLHGKGVGLPLTLRGDEPKELLTALADACDYIVQSQPPLYDNEDTPQKLTVKATSGEDYSIYRLKAWPSTYVGGMKASLYIRPEGAQTYNQAMEYGRNGEGIEASISYVVDPYLPYGELLEIGKHRKPGADNRISIRLDREGVKPALRNQAGVERNPTQEQGTLSLDVGSIIGDDEWLGTKLGRLLAWGNMLRTTAEGGDTQLNHSTRYFPESAGNSQVFASNARRMIARLEKRRFSPQEVEQFSGRTALTELH